MVGILQIGVICLLLGNARDAGHVFLLALVFALISPLTWGVLLGTAVASSKDD